MIPRIYAVGFATGDFNSDPLNIGGILVCNSNVSAIQKFCRGMGFKALGDYVKSYPGEFRYCSKLNMLSENAVDNSVTYKKNGILYHTNMGYRTYGMRYWTSQCEGVISEFKYHDSEVYVVPKIDDLCEELIGFQVSDCVVKDFSAIGCFCSDWNEELEEWEE